ncbi:MAG: universal stress protein [Thermodesulfobacteriota bacterium]
MPKVQKILFPIDFAAPYESLLPWVSTFVEKFEATLYVMFVAQDLSEFSSFYVPHASIQGFQEEALAAAQKKMAAAVQESFKKFPKIETRVAVGAPAAKILETVQKEQIDLIIMGTHGRKGLERTIFGSVADKIVGSAPCPVLTISPNT